jgi:hypothetical protein
MTNLKEEWLQEMFIIVQLENATTSSTFQHASDKIHCTVYDF